MLCYAFGNILYLRGVLVQHPVDYKPCLLNTRVRVLKSGRLSSILLNNSM